MLKRQMQQYDWSPGRFRVEVLVALGVAIGWCGALASAQDAARDTVELRWDFTAGEVYDVELKQVSQNRSEVIGRTVETDQEVQVWLEWTVDAVDGDSAEMTWKFKRIKSRLSNVEIVPGAAGGSPIPDVIEFDTASERPSEAAASRLWRGVEPLIDQPLSVTMTRRGEIRQVTIPPETLEQFQQVAGTMSLRRMLTEEGVSDLFGQTGLVFPETVAEGETWSSDRSIEIPLGRIKQTTSYTYRGPQPFESDDGDADAGETLELIELTARSEIDSYTDDGRPRLVIDEQSCRGAIWFDRQTGMMRSGQVTASIETSSAYRDMEIQGRMLTEQSISVSRRGD